MIFLIIMLKNKLYFLKLLIINKKKNYNTNFNLKKNNILNK